ncbi:MULTISPECIES: hypothetical protein [Bacillaceae]|nr:MULTISPECIES: hypothetical protein [Bacillaceae]
MARSTGSLKNLVKMGVKYGPIIYPFIKNYLNKRKAAKAYRPR